LSGSCSPAAPGRGHPYVVAPRARGHDVEIGPAHSPLPGQIAAPDRVLPGEALPQLRLAVPALLGRLLDRQRLRLPLPQAEIQLGRDAPQERRARLPVALVVRGL